MLDHEELGPDAFLNLALTDKLWGTQVDDIRVLRRNERRIANDLLRLFLACKIPITLWGPVGARKTRTIEALSREVDANGVPYQVISIQPSTEDPTIIHGMMYIVDDKDTGETVMKKSIPDVAKSIIEYHQETNGYTILFLDEMTTCIPTQQHALLGTLTHGKYGPYSIHDYAAMVMAANPENTVSTVHPLGEQVLNRGGHIPWYGDMELFLEEWRTGFGDMSRAPDNDVDWFVSSLMEEAPELVFRNRNWSIEDLVPYDMMEHSERIVTEHSRMINLILDVFKDSSKKARNHYMVQATKAMLGRDWALRMESVCERDLERKDVDTGRIIKIVQENGVSPTWDIETLQRTLEHRLYFTSRGERLRRDQINSLVTGLFKLVESDSDVDAYQALWALAMTAPNDELRSMLHLHLTKLLMIGLRWRKEERLTKEEAVPRYIPQEVKETLLVAIKRSSVASA